MGASREAVAVAWNQALVFHHAIEKGRLIRGGEVRRLDSKTERPKPVIGRIDDRHHLGRHRDLIAQSNAIEPVYAVITKTELRIETEPKWPLVLPCA